MDTSFTWKYSTVPALALYLTQEERVLKGAVVKAAARAEAPAAKREAVRPWG